MDRRPAVPDWLTPVAWTSITLSLLSVAFIAVDIYLLRRHHAGGVSELVWITSALYLGPLAAVAYLRLGRTDPACERAAASTAGQGPGTAIAVLPGGGASAVAHLIAVPLVVAVGWTIAGLAMWPMIVVIAVLATAMSAIHERVASDDPAVRSEPRVSVGAALGAALITIAAFDIGMVGWMLLLHVNDLMPPVTEGTFWFLMQIGVVVGLLTGYPAVSWLLRRNQTVVPA